MWAVLEEWGKQTAHDEVTMSCELTWSDAVNMHSLRASIVGTKKKLY